MQIYYTMVFYCALMIYFRNRWINLFSCSLLLHQKFVIPCGFIVIICKKLLLRSHYLLKKVKECWESFLLSKVSRST